MNERKCYRCGRGRAHYCIGCVKELEDHQYREGRKRGAKTIGELPAKEQAAALRALAGGYDGTDLGWGES